MNVPSLPVNAFVTPVFQKYHSRRGTLGTMSLALMMLKIFLVSALFGKALISVALGVAKVYVGVVLFL